ncbi:Coenzyme A biosynthesis bifunctional protein CoaBC [compost metagenome]
MVEPGEGLLACGYIGKGRMEEPETIVAVVNSFFDRQNKIAFRPLAGKKVVVTAGGTVERIDPVRYISNDSSGKMGFAIAKAACELGADVVLIAANTKLAPPSGVKVISLESAKEMYDAVAAEWNDTDILVKSAAVADYRPKEVSEQKIKKSGDTMTLELVKNIDILETFGRLKTSQFLIGFAAETTNVEHYAMDKLHRKNCDLLVANDVTKAGAGFGIDTNVVSIYDGDGLVESLPLQSKDEVGLRIMELAAQRLSGAKL